MDSGLDKHSIRFTTSHDHRSTKSLNSYHEVILWTTYLAICNSKPTLLFCQVASFVAMQ